MIALLHFCKATLDVHVGVFRCLEHLVIVVGLKKRTEPLPT